MGNNIGKFKNKSDNIKNAISNDVLIVKKESKEEEIKSLYPAPNNDIEKDRLNHQYFLFKHFIKDNVDEIPEKTNILDDKIAILDLGCGTGAWCLDMATDYPNSYVYGVDIYEKFPKEICPANCKFKVMNSLHIRELEKLNIELKSDLNKNEEYADIKFYYVHQSLMFGVFKRHEWNTIFKNIYNFLETNGLVEFFEIDLIIKKYDNKELSVIEEPIIFEINQRFQIYFKKVDIDNMSVSNIDKKLYENKFNLIYKKIFPIRLGGDNSLTREFVDIWATALENAKDYLMNENETYKEYENKIIQFKNALYNSSNYYTNFYIFIAQKLSINNNVLFLKIIFSLILKISM